MQNKGPLLLQRLEPGAGAGTGAQLQRCRGTVQRMLQKQ